MKELLQFDSKKYFYESGLNEFLVSECKLDIGEVSFEKQSTVYSPSFSVDPENTEPYPLELDDLTRLHWLVTSNRMTTVLEFGIGYSTLVMAHAIRQNSNKYGDYVKQNLRRNNAFEIWSVDTNEDYINLSLNRIPKKYKKYVNAMFSHARMSEYCGKICTLFDTLPNICPDFIYLDGPDQFTTKGEVRGIHNRHPDRLPMVADLLSLEYYLLPGTIILTDGRTSNARFLRNNFQREWSYIHDPNIDISLFRLDESPLGRYNRLELEFKAGDPNNKSRVF